MTNEQIVEQIRKGVSVTDNMERLYMDNLPLIKKFIKPYMNYEPEEDLLQEAYFGLLKAIQHYETSENVLFMTYANYWIRRQVQNYIQNCGSVMRISSNYIQRMDRYKKSVREYEQLYGKTPTDKDMAGFMGISIDEIRRIRLYAAEVRSIDTPIQGSEDLCLSDTLESDFNLENSTIDKIYEEYQKKELWGIVERYSDDWQRDIIKQHFQEGKTIAEIARESGRSAQAIRVQKEKGLRKLRTGRASKEIREKLEVLEAGAYRTGVNQFRRHDYTSIVEYMAIRKMEMEERYKQAVSG